MSALILNYALVPRLLLYSTYFEETNLYFIVHTLRCISWVACWSCVCQNRGVKVF